MVSFLGLLLHVLAAPFKSQARLEAEIVFLRHQLNLLRLWLLKNLSRRSTAFQSDIRDRPTAPRSPWQNGYIERLIGSIRRECLDHVLVMGEAHLRRILSAYADYYNRVRTHLALDKDAPLGRRAQAIGSLAAIPLLGGLHHEYVRMA